MFAKLKFLFTDPVLRGRLFFIIGALVVFRVLAAIPMPGVDASQLEQFLENNQFFGLLNILSGSGLSTLSLVMLGVGPYITASIIFQLATVLVPKLKELQQEGGEEGKRKITQWSRLATFPLALIQGFSLIALLAQQGVIDPLSGFSLALALTVVAAGTYLLMWIGEMISERGFGNGVSIIIFAGIVATLPQVIGQYIFGFDASQVPTLLMFVGLGLVTIFGVVYFTEAERPIPVHYARQARGGATYGTTQTYLPIRVTLAGVMPIIFALSLFLFPQLLARVFATSSNAILASVSSGITTFFQNYWLYGSIYFLLVFFATFFYTGIVFEPEKVSENLQKSGGFIPGIRPGKPTTEYIEDVVTRVTFVGALFFAIIAVLPVVLTGITGNQALALGGTSLLIVVSVVIDLIKKVDAQLSLKEYM
ncbi:MAG: preprotein translocase subunit SecY [Minisyncoccia bacterium]